jgi:hypothetical protein
LSTLFASLAISSASDCPSDIVFDVLDRDAIAHRHHGRSGKASSFFFSSAFFSST